MHEHLKPVLTQQPKGMLFQVLWVLTNAGEPEVQIVHRRAPLFAYETARNLAEFGTATHSLQTDHVQTNEVFLVSIAQRLNGGVHVHVWAVAIEDIQVSSAESTPARILVGVRGVSPLDKGDGRRAERA